MDRLDLILFNATKPGALQMKDQILGALVIAPVFRQAESNAGKNMTIGLDLKPKVSVHRFGMHEAFTGEQKGRLRIAFAKRLKRLQCPCEIPG